MKRISIVGTALLLALAALVAGPAAADASGLHAAAAACSAAAYPPAPHAQIMASTTNPAVGEKIEVSGAAYCPNESVKITLAGTFVATAHTNAQGSFDPHITVDKAGSALALCGVGASGLATDRDCLTLSTVAATTANAGGSGTGSNSGGGGTALTGTDIALLCLIAAILLGIGGSLIVAGRRRRLASAQQS